MRQTQTLSRRRLLAKTAAVTPWPVSFPPTSWAAPPDAQRPSGPGSRRASN